MAWTMKPYEASGPDIILLLMPGFGNTGPYKRYRSMGMTMDAIIGHSTLRGYPDMDLSTITPVHHADAIAGVTAVFAMTTALHYRARTGHGQFIDLSQAEASIPHLGEILMEYAMNGVVRERMGNRHPSMAPHGCYACKGDDKWITIAVRNDQEWQTLCKVIKRPELAFDERFATSLSRLRHQDELDSIISQWTLQKDRYKVMRDLQANGIPVGPVLDCCGDTYDDPHLQARDYFLEVNHPEAGIHLYSGPLWKLASDPKPAQTPVPCLGADNEYVLGDLLGLSQEMMQELEIQQIIGTAPLEGADMGGVRRVQRGF